MLIWGMDEKKRIAELEKVVRDQSFTIKALDQTVAELSRIAAANEERELFHPIGGVNANLFLCTLSPTLQMDTTFYLPN